MREFSSVPVIFLTSKDDELDEALGLAMGADGDVADLSKRPTSGRMRPSLQNRKDR